MSLKTLKNLLPNEPEINALTINEIEIKELNGNPLTPDELEALQNFRMYRLENLKKASKKESQFSEVLTFFKKASHYIDYRKFLELNI